MRVRLLAPYSYKDEKGKIVDYIAGEVTDLPDDEALRLKDKGKVEIVEGAESPAEMKAAEKFEKAKTELAKKEAELKKLADKLAAKEKELSQKESDLMEKAKELEAREAELQAKEKEMAEKE